MPHCAITSCARSGCPPRSIDRLTSSRTDASACDEAMTVADGLLVAADATENPQINSLALNAYAWA